MPPIFQSVRIDPGVIRLEQQCDGAPMSSATDAPHGVCAAIIALSCLLSRTAPREIVSIAPRYDID